MTDMMDVKVGVRIAIIVTIALVLIAALAAVFMLLAYRTPSADISNLSLSDIGSERTDFTVSLTLLMRNPNSLPLRVYEATATVSIDGYGIGGKYWEMNERIGRNGEYELLLYIEIDDVEDRLSRGTLMKVEGELHFRYMGLERRSGFENERKLEGDMVRLVNEYPVAGITGPVQAQRGGTVQFDGTSSYDPDGTIDFYRWDFGDGTTLNGPIVTHTYQVIGTYTVKLNVLDNKGDEAVAFHDIRITLLP